MTKYGVLIISKIGQSNSKCRRKPIRILVSPLESVVASFQNRLKVEPVSKTSSVVALSIQPGNKASGRLLEYFNRYLQ
jgi:hypothetical protein